MQDFARCSRSAPGFWTKLRALKLISTEQNICSEIAIALSTGPRNTWLAWQRSVFKCSRCANHCCAQIPGHHQRRTLNWICQQLITQHHVNTMLQFPNETSYTNSNTKPPECVCVCSDVETKTAGMGTQSALSRTACDCALRDVNTSTHQSRVRSSFRSKQGNLISALGGLTHTVHASEPKSKSVDIIIAATHNAHTTISARLRCDVVCAHADKMGWGAVHCAPLYRRKCLESENSTCLFG